MASTNGPEGHPEPADWRSAGLRYYSRNFFNRRRFGGRVWKVGVDGGFACPNRDGTLDSVGCVFCNPESFSPGRRRGAAAIADQIDEGLHRLRVRHDVDWFVVYFQPATNTYAPVDRLADLYRQALAYPGAVGLVVGTRPDCVPDEVLDLLAELSRETWLSVEFGLQSIHDRSLDWMHRGHHYDAFVDAVRRSQCRGIEVGAHVILGLPGELPDDMRATARALAGLRIDSLKIHNLHAVCDTPLAEMVRRGEVRLAGLDEYVGWVVDFLEETPPDCVIDRLSGDAPPHYLVGPSWCRNRSGVRAAIDAELQRRDTWQGRRATTTGEDDASDRGAGGR